MTDNVPARLDSKGLRRMLEDRVTVLQQTLPSHVKPEALIRSVVIACQKNPKILECTRESILTSAMQAAELGLDCSGGTLGQGALVPYKGTCQFIPMYRGLIDLARRAGDFVTFFAEVVYSNDTFRVTQGTSPKIEHEPCLDADRGELTHTYAVAKMRGSEEVQWTVMTKAEVEAIRNRSNGWKASQQYGKDNPWSTDPAEMWKKTALRRLVKYLPLSSEKVKRALEFGDSEFRFDQAERPAPAGTKTERLAAILKAEPAIPETPSERIDTPEDGATSCNSAQDEQNDHHSAPPAPSNGKEAHEAGFPRSANPHPEGTPEHGKWDVAWGKADRA
jgi:recombination protein RecT